MAARCDRTTARTANTQQPSEQMEPRRDTLVRSRLTEPVHYSSRCFVADCPIGSLAVDALCMWSEYEKDGDGLEVCLLPTRSLQTGIYAGVVDSEAVAAAMPDDNVVTLFLTVAQLVLACAARRKESRGLHFTRDYVHATDSEKRDTVLSSSDVDLQLTRAMPELVSR